MIQTQVYSLIWLLWNVVVFVAYGVDKGKARQGYFRISEKTLLAMTIFGGLGGLAGGRFFRHKTKKWYFQVTWYLSSVMNIGLMYWMWRQIG